MGNAVQCKYPPCLVNSSHVYCKLHRCKYIGNNIHEPCENFSLHEYCLKHRCNKHLCYNSRMKYIKYCDIHKCQMCEYRSRASDKEFCDFCSCGVDKCSKLFPCSDHLVHCSIPDCNTILKNKRFKYCIKHRCSKICQNPAIIGQVYCKDHKCLVAECKFQNTNNNAYCTRHSCKYSGRNKLICNKLICDNSHRCKDHKCIFKECTETIYNLNLKHYCDYHYEIQCCFEDIEKEKQNR